jgi:hypothetical protein
VRLGPQDAGLTLMNYPEEEAWVRRAGGGSMT